MALGDSDWGVTIYSFCLYILKGTSGTGNPCSSYLASILTAAYPSSAPQLLTDMTRVCTGQPCVISTDVKATEVGWPKDQIQRGFPLRRRAPWCMGFVWEGFGSWRAIGVAFCEKLVEASPVSNGANASWFQHGSTACQGRAHQKW